MSSIFSRIVAVGIVAAGFTLTGDLSRLVRRGLEVLNARDVPAARDTHDAAAEPAADVVASEPVDLVEKTVVDAVSPGVAKGSRAAVAREADFHPPAKGLDRIDLATVPAGDRVVVWLAVPRRSGGRAYRCLACDIIDAATGEALLYEVAAVGPDGTPQAATVPPRRVRLKGAGSAGELVAGGMLDLQRRGITDDGVGHEQIGPIAALDLAR